MSKKEISSGAEKAEALQNKTGAESKKKTEAQKKEGSANKLPNAKVKARTGKPTPINKQENKRKTAEVKAENKKQKQLKAAKVAQERREARLAKIEAKNAKRKQKLAEMRAKRESRLKERAIKRANKKERKHAPGFGGWLAAVISLGATTLVLGSVLTFGFMNVTSMRSSMAGLQTQSVYELNSVLDDLDVNLAKAKASSSNLDQTKILTSIVVDSEIAEVILEKLPMECTLTQKTTYFINGMGQTAKALLYKVASGEALTKSDRETIANLYSTNLKLKTAVNELTSSVNEKDFIMMIEGKADCMVNKSFEKIENEIFNIEESLNSASDKITAKLLQSEKEISAPEAAEMAKKYFKNYNVKESVCTGEAISNDLSVYNVNLVFEDEQQAFAQISKMGGKVVAFECFKECNDKKFSIDRCVDIAKDFLTSLGYDNLKAVWSSENGTTCNLTFAYVNDGVVYYTDEIKVKVCEERGKVSGINALSYVLNHQTRDEKNAKISKDLVAKNLSDDLKIISSRLAVIPQNGNETLCWEFETTNGENDYYIYFDANSGKEIEIYTVIGTKQGRALL